MVKDRPIKDSKKRRGFKTGSVRDIDDGKGRPSLLSPIVEIALSKHFQKGGAKYGWRNWEKGQPLSALLDSARRHELEYRMGYNDENHLIAWLWNVYCFVHTKYAIDMGILPKSLDDLPNYLKGKPKKDLTKKQFLKHWDKLVKQEFKKQVKKKRKKDKKKKSFHKS